MINDPERKKQEFLKGVGVKMVNDPESYEWYPARYEGEWAIPEDWEIPTNFNPSPKCIDRHKRACHIPRMLDELAECRYLKWKLVNGGFDTYKEHVRYHRLAKRLGILATRGKPWPSKWKDLLKQYLKKGLTINSACKKIQIPQRTISRWYNDYPDFRAELDAAQMFYLVKTLNVVNDILEEGSEKNRLDAAKFILERRFREEYGPRNILEIDEAVSPMDIILGNDSTKDDDEDYEI